VLEAAQRSVALTILSALTLILLFLYLGFVLQSLAWKITFFSLSGIVFGGFAWFLVDRVRFGQTEATQVWKRSSIVTTLFLVVAILGLGYYQVERLKIKIDLTKEGVLSLSPQTKKILDQLNQDVEIIGFFSKEGRPEGGASDQFAVERGLNLFREYSSRIILRFVDPDADLILTQRYNVTEYGALVILSGLNKATAYRSDYFKRQFTGPRQPPVEQNKIEEVVASKIMGLFESGKRVVFFTTGHGESSISGSSEGTGLALISERLQGENYRVTNGRILDLQADILNGEITVVVIAGPRADFLTQEIQVLERASEIGVNILALLGPAVRGRGLSSRSRLGQYLKKSWSIDLGNNLVFTIGQTIFGMALHTQPALFYRDHTVTKPLLGRERTQMIQCRSVTEADDSESQISVILETETENTWAETDLTSDQPRYTEGPDIEGPVSVALVAEKDIADEKRIRPQSRMIVFGNANFMTDGNLRQGGDDLGYYDLMMNSIGFLAGKTASITVRPKTPARERLFLDGETMIIITIVTVFFPPLALIFTGIFLYTRRRRR